MSEQFENSIRKRLQEAEPPFDPAAWDQMKKRLDDSSGRRPAFWWWVGGLLLLLGVGGWWWFSQNQDENRTDLNNHISVTGSTIKGDTDVDKQAPGDQSTQNNIAPETNVPAGTGTADGVNNPAEKNAPPANRGITSDASNQANKITLPDAGNPTPGVNNSAKSAAAQPNAQVSTSGMINRADKITPPTNAGIPASGVNKPVNENASPINPAVNNQADKNASSTNSGVPGANNQPDKNTTPTNAGIPSSGVNNQPAVTNPATDTTTTSTRKPRKRGFDAGITLGPDFNTTPSLKNGRIGFGGGLLIRYHISNSIYLSTGAAYTKKLYDARDEDYYSSYPTNYKKIAADCNVLDVPLNVHYTFLHRPKSSWSVMAGASSYFMLKEKYEYYTNSGGKYKREFSNKNQHYFSVLNLGFSYERETPGRINWGLQPYVKLPMGGVGEGKVNLYSAGVSLQVTIGKK